MREDGRGGKKERRVRERERKVVENKCRECDAGNGREGKGGEREREREQQRQSGRETQ